MMNIFWALTVIGIFADSLVAAQSANAIGSQGYTTINTDGFVLELDVANQVATRLTTTRTANSGNTDFNFLLPAGTRTADGNYFLGDFQARFRLNGTSAWTDVASHSTRKPVRVTPRSGNVLTTSDITAALGSNLPIKVERTWSKDRESIVMTFNITNVGTGAVEMGAVGIPVPVNNNWVGKNQDDTWLQSAVSDPAMLLDAGYVITNRLTGRSPTLITTPVEKTPLEAYRLNNNQARWPSQWVEKSNVDFSYEGIFSWWMATKGLVDIDTAAASQLNFQRGGEWNTPTSFFIQPGQSRVVGLRFFATPTPRDVETRLVQFDRPTIVGVPGFVVPTGEQAKMIIRTSAGAPRIGSVSPAIIDFGAPVAIENGVYSVTGTVRANNFGRSRVTINFANGEVGTAHYYVTTPYSKQLDNLGTFRFTKQWYNNTSDFFKRAPGIISYDHQKGKQLIDEQRAWIAGMSDEAGSGSFVSAAAKQLGRPNKQQVGMLEQFATQTLFGKLQISTQGNTYGGVKKSLFYYDPTLEGRGVYDSGINHGSTWRKSESDRLDRGYNYPHVAIVYWTLYRLARNNVGLVTSQSWNWYLDRAYDTIIGLRNNAGIYHGYSEFGLMEGTYFREILLDLEREGTTNSTYTSRANDVRAFMKSRADLWNGQRFPFASEFPWDNTGQEEVFAWSKYFGSAYDQTALNTVEALMAVMSSVPSWGYSGAGRDLWDFLYSGQLGSGARIERTLHHYKGAQSALPLVDQFLNYPRDIAMLRAGYGGVLGSLTSIFSDGFGSTGFHTRYDYLDWDPASGDNGVSIALHALSTRAVLVNDASVGGWTGFGAAVTVDGSTIRSRPYDSFRQRFFIADNALYLQLDAGHFTSVAYNTANGEVTVVFDANDGFTPNARIRWSTTASTSTSGQYSIRGSFNKERGASVVPLSSSGTTTVVLGK